MAVHLPERGHRHGAHRSRGPPRGDHHHRRGELPPPCGRGETEVGASARLPLTRRVSVQIPAVSQVRQHLRHLLKNSASVRAAAQSLVWTTSLLCLKELTQYDENC